MQHKANITAPRITPEIISALTVNVVSYSARDAAGIPASGMSAKCVCASTTQ